MAIRKYKPVTPGQRHKTSLDFSELTKKSPEKTLVKSVAKTDRKSVV